MESKIDILQKALGAIEEKDMARAVLLLSEYSALL